MPRPKKGSPEAKAWGEQMKKQRAAKSEQKTVIDEGVVDDVAGEQGLDELRAQMQEVMETNALLKAVLLNPSSNQSSGQSGINVSKAGGLVGEVEKYLIDPDHYPDPTTRLSAEPKLVAALNFPYNYELQYTVGVSSYENKAGVNMREPKFTIGLHRIVIDEQGNQTDKRYVARRLVFHEDPQAALVIARDNGIAVDRTNEKAFLDEMRYLRCRDWLFDIFWPKPAQESESIKEEVIGNTLVQVFTKKSLDATGVDFEKINTKISV